MASEQLSSDAAGLRDVAAAVLRNWHDELAQYFSERLPHLAQRQERLVVECAGDTLTFLSEATDSHRTLGEFSRADGEAAIACLADAGAPGSGPAAKIVRLLHPPVFPRAS